MLEAEPDNHQQEERQAKRLEEGGAEFSGEEVAERTAGGFEDHSSIRFTGCASRNRRRRSVSQGWLANSDEAATPSSTCLFPEPEK